MPGGLSRARDRPVHYVSPYCFRPLAADALGRATTIGSSAYPGVPAFSYLIQGGLRARQAGRYDLPRRRGPGRERAPESGASRAVSNGVARRGTIDMAAQGCAVGVQAMEMEGYRPVRVG